MTTSQGWLPVAARAGSCHISPRVGRRVPFVWPLLRPRYAPGNRSFLVYLNRPWVEMEGERGGAFVLPSGVPHSCVSARGTGVIAFSLILFTCIESQTRFASQDKMMCPFLKSPSHWLPISWGKPFCRVAEHIFSPRGVRMPLWLFYNFF